jgi:hypothetical protein
LILSLTISASGACRNYRLLEGMSVFDEIADIGHAKNSLRLVYKYATLIRRSRAAEVSQAQNPKTVEFRARYFEPPLCGMLAGV